MSETSHSRDGQQELWSERDDQPQLNLRLSIDRMPTGHHRLGFGLKVTDRWHGHVASSAGWFGPFDGVLELRKQAADLVGRWYPPAMASVYHDPSPLSWTGYDPDAYWHDVSCWPWKYKPSP